MTELNTPAILSPDEESLGYALSKITCTMVVSTASEIHDEARSSIRGAAKPASVVTYEHSGKSLCFELPEGSLL